MSSLARVKKPSADDMNLHRKILLILLFTLVLNLASVAHAQTAPSLSFVPVTPCRIADTRNTAGPFGGPALAAKGTRSFVIPSSSCNIPTTALAYALNFTVVPHVTLGFLTVWPTGESQPLVSTLNSYDGRVKANAAILPAGSGGAISLYATDETDVVIDISGYFVADTSTTALAFFPLTPCRVVDTRNADAPLGGPYMAGNQERSFPLLTSSCGIPSFAEAYSLNFTVVPHVPLWYLTVWPTGQSQPLVSTLNAYTGTVTANAASVPGRFPGGYLCLCNQRYRPGNRHQWLLCSCIKFLSAAMAPKHCTLSCSGYQDLRSHPASYSYRGRHLQRTECSRGLCV